MAASMHKPTRAKGMVHHLVAETAKGIAETVYEEAAHSNQFYATWPTCEGFVRRRWTTFIQAARESLAELLNPEKHYMSSEAMRQEIHAALLLNAAVAPAANSDFNEAPTNIH